MCRPETCRDLSKWGYLHCLKVLSKKSVIQIFDDVIANHDIHVSRKGCADYFYVSDYMIYFGGFKIFSFIFWGENFLGLSVPSLSSF